MTIPVEWAEKIMAHAQEHYNDGGWDVIVECETVESLVTFWSDETYSPAPKTYKELFTRVSAVVDVWADREADARNSAF